MIKTLHIFVGSFLAVIATATISPISTLPEVEPISSAVMITAGVGIFLIALVLIVFIQLRQNKNEKEDDE